MPFTAGVWRGEAAIEWPTCIEIKPGPEGCVEVGYAGAESVMTLPLVPVAKRRNSAAQVVQ